MTKKNSDALTGLEPPATLPGWNVRNEPPLQIDPEFEDSLSKALDEGVGNNKHVRTAAHRATEIKHAPETPGLRAMNDPSKLTAGAYIGGKWVPGAPKRTSPAKRVARAERIAKQLDQREYTGGSTSYYELDILHPHKAKRKPYMAECLDIIEALGMSFTEGECFKAIWRKCAARQGKSKRGYVDAKYDAEKIVFYGQRILDDVINPKGNKS